jgi:hypothetical protein
MRRWLPLACLCVAACRGRIDACPLPSEPSGATFRGDVDGDGRVDLADGLRIVRAVHAGVPLPCPEASEVVVDGKQNAADGFAVWSAIFPGVTTLPGPVACAAPAPLAEATCARVDVGFEADRPGTGAVPVRLVLYASDVPVEAWSFGVRADGCRIAAATLDGTAGADVTAGGSRRNGYAFARAQDGLAVGAVVLDWQTPTTLGLDQAQILLSLGLEKDEACACTLSLADDVAIGGSPVRNALVVDSRSYDVSGTKAKIDVCP